MPKMTLKEQRKGLQYLLLKHNHFLLLNPRTDFLIYLNHILIIMGNRGNGYF